MEPIQITTTLVTAVAGALVLASYVLGIKRAESPVALWGGVTKPMQKAIVPVMLLAAVGFLACFILLVFVNDVSVIDGLRWPWGASDGEGGTRLLITLALFLVPSIFWLEMTRQHLMRRARWTQMLTIGILAIVGIATLMLVALTYGAWQDGATGGVWMFLGAIAIAIQCAVNDAIIWVIMFPWDVE